MKSPKGVMWASKSSSPIDNLDENHMIMAFPRELTVGTFNLFAAAITVLLLSGVMPKVETDYLYEKTLIIFPITRPELNPELYDYLGG